MLPPPPLALGGRERAAIAAARPELARCGDLMVASFVGLGDLLGMAKERIQELLDKEII